MNEKFCPATGVGGFMNEGTVVLLPFVTEEDNTNVEVFFSYRLREKLQKLHQ